MHNMHNNAYAESPMFIDGAFGEIQRVRSVFAFFGNVNIMKAG